MQMISKKDLSDAEMDALTKSCSPMIVITANGEVQTHDEATVRVNELDIFLTMKVLENTPAVLSLGKLCDEKRIFLRMDQWSKNHIFLKKTGFDTLQHGELRSCRGVQACQVRPLDLHQLQKTLSRQESHCSSSSSSSSSSRAVGEIQVRERELTVTSLQCK